MDVLAPVAIFALMLIAAVVVSGPLRRGAASQAEARDESDRDDLNAQRDAKYREIRDSELDYQTGKLTESDFKVIDRQLRAEAADILRKIDELG